MFESLKRLLKLKTLGNSLADALVCHRTIYSGLAICHGLGCILTDYPELYGPMAVLYAILALLAKRE